VAPIDLNFGPYKAFKDASFESDIIEFFSDLNKNHKACPGIQGLSSNVREQAVIPANEFENQANPNDCQIRNPHDCSAEKTARPVCQTNTNMHLTSISPMI